MKPHIFAAGVSALCSVLALPAMVHAAEQHSTTIHLNGENKGQFLVNVMDGGRILIARDDLVRLGIKDIPTE
ncbi:MAG TPA: hypothetical protein VGE50_00020, partial [Gammaproteobacteria bacterium]